MIVAIESASTDLSVALATPDGRSLSSAGWSSNQRQGHELMPRLLELLADEGSGIAGISALAVGIGPGSFTGLRVGMSVAKGLAYALGKPIVGIPSLEAWLSAEADAPAAVGRAGARDAYLLLRGEDGVRIMPSDELPPEVHRAPVVAPTELRTAFGLSASVAPMAAASAVARLAAARLSAHPEGDDLERLEPAYLRAPRGVGRIDEEAIRWP